MYLKVYYNPQKRKPSVPEVISALPADMAHLEVNDRIDFIQVIFPQSAPHADYQRVRKALQAAGFETE